MPWNIFKFERRWNRKIKKKSAYRIKRRKIKYINRFFLELNGNFLRGGIDFEVCEFRTLNGYILA